MSRTTLLAGLVAAALAPVSLMQSAVAQSALMAPGIASDVASGGSLREAGASPEQAVQREKNDVGGRMPGVQTRDALFSAFAQNGCRIEPANLPQVLSPLGFDHGFVKDTLTELRLEGLISEDAVGGLSLLPELCPPDQPAPTPREALLARFAQSDCRIARRETEALEQELGIGREQIRRILSPLFDAGTLTVENSTATLDPALCTATN